MEPAAAILDLLPTIKLDNLWLGPYLEVGNADFRRLFFTNCAGDQVPGSPSDGQIDQIGRWEPMTAALEVGGLFADRPHLAPEIFSAPTFKLASQAYLYDYFFLFDEPDGVENRNLHNFLSAISGTQPPGYFEDLTCDAVHDAPYSSPESLDKALLYLSQ